MSHVGSWRHGNQGHYLWMGAPPPLHRSHSYVVYRNDLSQTVSSRSPLPGPAILQPQQWSALRTGARSSQDFISLPWSRFPLREESSQLVPGQVQPLPQLSTPGSLGAGRGGWRGITHIFHGSLWVLWISLEQLFQMELKGFKIRP